jgi:thymidylate synthase (FAD)
VKAELIEVLGSDARVVDAARVSFSKDSSNYTEEQNTRLISYLARHNHFTPFTHVQITMREKVPIFVARQRFKHVVGWTYNEVSRRYVDDPPEFYVPDAWRLKSENKKQGSSDETVEEPRFTWGHDPYDYEEVLNLCHEYYHQLLKAGVAPEQARMVLPQSMYTEYIVTGSLYAWANAYKLRSSDDAQKEIRDLAEQWNEIIGGIPELKNSWRALIGKETT